MYSLPLQQTAIGPIPFGCMMQEHRYYAMLLLAWQFIPFIGWLNNDDVYRWYLLNLIQLFDFVSAYFIHFVIATKPNYAMYLSMIPKVPDPDYMLYMIHMYWLSACILDVLDAWYGEFTFTVSPSIQFIRLTILIKSNFCFWIPMVSSLRS